MYALGTEETMPDASLFADTVPDVKEAGDYVIWYCAMDRDRFPLSSPAFVHARLIPRPAPETADLVLPGQILTVSPEAFEGVPAKIVYVPDGCTDIGEGAFKDCRELQVIRLPENVELSDHVFDGCPSSLVLCGPSGGETEAWALANGFAILAEEAEEKEEAEIQP